MANTPQKPRARKAPAVVLPPVTPARFEEALKLVDELVDEQTDLFVAKGHEYRERHRTGTERHLTAQEAAQIAAAWSTAQDLPPVTVAEAVQQSELRAYDEPQPAEILLRAGIATAPAFMGAVQRFVALIEMDPDRFREARERGRHALAEALDADVAAREYDDLTGDDGARARAQRAFEHFSEAAGASSGKAWSLLPKVLMQVVEQATSALGLQPGPSSLTGSPPPTDGLAAPSSTTSPTRTP